MTGWTAFGKQPAMDSVGQDDAIIEEHTVETAAVPVCRFVKLGSTTGKVVLAGDTDRAIGVSREGNGPRADITAGTYSDYAVGDKAPTIKRTTGHVYVETDASTVVENDAITSAANGKAKVTTTSTNVVNGRAAGINPLVTARDGTKYIRMLPTWQIKEVVP